MKSLLLTPTYFPQLTGNAVTVQRISLELSRGGITCNIIDLSSLREKVLIERALEFAPDVIHNFHAWKSGRTGLKIKNLLGVPMITTTTGTDVNVDLGDCRKRDAILDVFAGSDGITVFNDQARATLLKNSVPSARMRVIHQSVLFPRQKKRNFRKPLGISDDMAVFLLLGSIRRIKNPRHAIKALEKVRETVPRIHLLIAGSVLEQGEFLKMERLIGNKKWITRLGGIPRENIRSLFRSVDFLLNTSSSESEANAVMEAMSCRTIVVGKDIPGNASLLTNETALLFHNRSEFHTKIMYALANRDRLDGMRERAKRTVEAEPFCLATEQKKYLEVYRKVCPGMAGRPIA
jgi:glycosyltransferase involved in cell wall biosynthesis